MPRPLVVLHGAVLRYAGWVDDMRAQQLCETMEGAEVCMVCLMAPKNTALNVPKTSHFSSKSFNLAIFAFYMNLRWRLRKRRLATVCLMARKNTALN